MGLCSQFWALVLWNQLWAPEANFGLEEPILGFGDNLGLGANLGFEPILGFGANFGLRKPILGLGSQFQGLRFKHVKLSP